MWKILLALLLISPSAWASWRNGTGEQTILGSSNAALIGYNSYNSIVQPLDNLLSGYCTEYLQYNSSSLINVVAGSCNVSNSQGTIHLFLQDTSNTVLSSSNLDTGSITASTTYYVYATAATNAATTSTYYISASSTAPSGQTYYYKIGQFSTDSNSNWSGIINNTWQTGYASGIPTSKSGGVPYQALTDGFVQGDVYLQAGAGAGQSSSSTFYTGSNSSISSSPNVGINMYNYVASGSTTGGKFPFCFFVRKGDYYEITSNVDTMYFVSLGK